MDSILFNTITLLGSFIIAAFAIFLLIEALLLLTETGGRKNDKRRF